MGGGDSGWGGLQFRSSSSSSNSTVCVLERVREFHPTSFMVSLVDGTYPTSLLQTVQQFRERELKLTN